MAESKRIGLYGSGDVPRSRRLRSRTAGPESLGLKDIRQLPPIRRVKPSGMRGKAIAASVIVALVAVFMAISAVALAPSAKPDPSADTEQAPGTPFPVTGLTFDIAGAPVGGVLLTLTNERIGLSGTTVSDTGSVDPAALGFYVFDLGSLGQTQSGDIIRIDAVSTTNTGTNSTAVPTPMGGFMWLNVTLNAAIPEFGEVLVPAVGMAGVFLVVMLVARTRND